MVPMALPCPAGWPSPRCAPTAQQQPKTGMQLALSWAETKAGCSAVLTQLCQIIVYLLIYCVNTDLWTAKKQNKIIIRSPCFSFWQRNLRNGFKIAEKIIICLHICDFVFNQHKYNTWKISNGMYKVAIRYSTQGKIWSCLPDFKKPYLSRENYPSLHSHTLFLSLLFGSMYIYLWATVFKGEAQEE